MLGGAKGVRKSAGSAAIPMGTPLVLCKHQQSLMLRRSSTASELRLYSKRSQISLPCLDKPVANTRRYGGGNNPQTP